MVVTKIGGAPVEVDVASRLLASARCLVSRGNGPLCPRLFSMVVLIVFFRFFNFLP